MTLSGHKGLMRVVCHGISGDLAPMSWARAAKEALMRPFILTLTLTAALAAPAHALVPINEEPVIRERLLQGFIGDAIADNCPTIEARKLRALGELSNLRDYALKQGYSSSVVREFVTSDVEKAKFKAEAAEWLKAKGAEPGQTEVYCAIGKEEIAKESLIGYLLRSRR
jgi:hypothetical protein